MYMNLFYGALKINNKARSDHLAPGFNFGI